MEQHASGLSEDGVPGVDVELLCLLVAERVGLETEHVHPRNQTEVLDDVPSDGLLSEAWVLLRGVGCWKEEGEEMLTDDLIEVAVGRSFEELALLAEPHDLVVEDLDDPV